MPEVLAGGGGQGGGGRKMGLQMDRLQTSDVETTDTSDSGVLHAPPGGRGDALGGAGV